jgi:hypothetical protein
VPLQLPLQQSVPVVHTGLVAPMLTHAQVPPLQKPLVQSPPAEHALPTLFF